MVAMQKWLTWALGCPLVRSLGISVSDILDLLMETEHSLGAAAVSSPDCLHLLLGDPSVSFGWRHDSEGNSWDATSLQLLYASMPLHSYLAWARRQIELTCRLHDLLNGGSLTYDICICLASIYKQNAPQSLLYQKHDWWNPEKAFQENLFCWCRGDSDVWFIYFLCLIREHKYVPKKQGSACLGKAVGCWCTQQLIVGSIVRWLWMLHIVVWCTLLLISFIWPKFASC